MSVQKAVTVSAVLHLQSDVYVKDTQVRWDKCYYHMCCHNWVSLSSECRHLVWTSVFRRSRLIVGLQSQILCQILSQCQVSVKKRKSISIWSNGIILLLWYSESFFLPVVCLNLGNDVLVFLFDWSVWLVYCVFVTLKTCCCLQHRKWSYNLTSD